MTEPVSEAVELLIARLLWDFPSEPSYWHPTPPMWAKDTLNDDDTAKCGDCGSWLESVRPGKFQCPACGSDSDKAARWKAADALTAFAAREDELRRELKEARNNFSVLEHEVVGATGLSAITVASELRARAEEAEARIAQAVADEREACAAMLSFSADELRLYMGELSAQELRTLKAFISWRAVAIRSRSKETSPRALLQREKQP